MVQDELDLTVEQYANLEDAGLEWTLDEGSSGDTPNSYYAEVPEGVDPDILQEKGWKVGDVLRVPLWAFDEDDQDY